MKFFGRWLVSNVEGSKTLYRLENPVGVPWHELWGVDLEDAVGITPSHKVVPPNNLIFDESSSWIARGIYPQTYGRRAATHHDFGTNAHKYSVEELYIELKPWFDSLSWDYDHAIEYIHWLRDRPRSAWDYEYYVLAKYDSVPDGLRWCAWKILRLVGWYQWNKPATPWTKNYRSCGSPLCVKPSC
jgi:hypothetical protein